MARSPIRHIFRWDLDKTYLRTDFDSVGDLVRTARMSAEQRENIPGSASLIRAIRSSSDGGAAHLVYFISGSPQQMRPVLEKKFALDGFVPDGFVLKPTLRHLLRGRFRAVRNQVGYKLSQLILGRTEAPVGTGETLFGDDAESDAFIYSLYADIVSGRIDRGQLPDLLRLTGCYPDQIETIEAGLESVVREDPVRRIVIHLDDPTPPVAFEPYFPLVVPIYSHLQTAIVLYLDGTLPAGAVWSVAVELAMVYGFDEKRLANLAEDILRRRRLFYPAEKLDELASELRSSSPEGEAPEVTTAAEPIVSAIAERTEHVRSRPTTEDVPAELGQGRRDYRELWAQDGKRRDEAKRARKLLAKTRAEAEAEAKKLAKRG